MGAFEESKRLGGGGFGAASNTEQSQNPLTTVLLDEYVSADARASTQHLADGVCAEHLGENASGAKQPSTQLLMPSALLHKLRVRLLPPLALGYALSFIDRSNLAFAELTMGHELQLSADGFGLAAGVFFSSYCAMQLPCLYTLAVTDARRVLAACLLGWGCCATGMAAVNSLLSLCIVRFCLGFAEAGFYPGVLFFLTRWFPRSHVSTPTQVLSVAAGGGYFIGSVSSGPLMSSFDGVLGLAGWRWLFLLQGSPAVLLGLWVLAHLPSEPSAATWLDASERDVLLSCLGLEAERREPQPELGGTPFLAPLPSSSSSEDSSQRVDCACADASAGANGLSHETPARGAAAHADGRQAAHDVHGAQSQPFKRVHAATDAGGVRALLDATVEALRQPYMWLFAANHFGAAMLAYVVSFFLPMELKEVLPSWPLWKLSLLLGVPIACSAVTGPLLTLWSERATGEWNRKRRLVVCAFGCTGTGGLMMLCAGIAMLGSGNASSRAPRRAVLSGTALGLSGFTHTLIYNAMGSFWALHHTVTPPHLWHVSIALVNSLGNLGGFAGPYALGALHDAFGSGCLPSPGKVLPPKKGNCLGGWGGGTIIISGFSLTVFVAVAFAVVVGILSVRPPCWRPRSRKRALLA
mmetsp:Transcript_21258/g.41467  ORF Transcript_21258/g.41467 Transcript_21258/m.41467 type:complete len:638 (-) Transcript_21258:678-2591(-)